MFVLRSVKNPSQDNILTDTFANDWNSTWEKFALTDSCQTLRTNDYPFMDRSSEKLQRAVQQVLSFGNHVREHWHQFAAFIGFGSCMTVNMAWILAMASLTAPGSYPAKLAEVGVKMQMLF